MSDRSEANDFSGVVKGRVRCPNPNCDENFGCCVCDHTGWITAESLEEMMII